MRSLALAYYCVKRIARHRATLLTLVLLPVIMAVMRAAAPALHWAGPVACALLTFAIFFAQHLTDDARGLLVGIKSAPIPESSPLVARLVAGALVFGAQMALFGTLATVIARP